VNADCYGPSASIALHRVAVHDINSSRNGSVIYYELFFKEKKRLWVIMAVLSIVLDARNIMLELRPSLEHPGNFHYEDKCWVISQIYIDVCFAF
jgi:hypothetical protein